MLDRHFVDAYVEATGARADLVPYGADKCRQLGRDLSAMAAQGRLRRGRVSIAGLAGQGFPTCVWSYRLVADPASTSI